jgi:hypothetical protein
VGTAHAVAFVTILVLAGAARELESCPIFSGLKLIGQFVIGRQVINQWHPFSFLAPNQGAPLGPCRKSEIW